MPQNNFTKKNTLLLLLTSSILSFSACGLKVMLPQKAVVSATERENLAALPKEEINYSSPPLVEFPIIPIQIFGLTYDEDIVIVTKHPEWNMHEFACINTPSGKLWLMKDAREGSLDQFVTVNQGDLIDLLPEVAVEIAVKPVKIQDNSTDERMDIVFEYENALGEQVKATYQGKRKLQALKKRNGSSMGHSKNQLLVVLDLPRRNFGKKASISYSGKNYKVKKLLGIKKFQMLLTQTQAGLSTGIFSLFKDKDGSLKTKHENKTNTVQEWRLQEKNDNLLLVQRNNFRAVSYQFKKSELKEVEVYNLTSANVQLWDKDVKAFNIAFFPPLPDLRRKFEGAYRSTFLLDVNGQQNHGRGEIVCRWEGDQLLLDIVPLSPWWIADRPMQTVIDFGTGEVKINCRMNPIDE